MNDVAGNPRGIGDALDRALADSPFLRLLATRRREVVERVLADGVDAAITAARSEAAAEPVARRLRRERQAVALAVGLGDLAGILSFEQVTAHLSDFADHALDVAIRTAIVERTPDAEPRGFVALGLGKHGSRELNYSSDIDPILLFDPATLPLRPREDPGEAAVRIARRVVELLQARDADGYVLRVDLRLRPSPEANPLAIPYAQALLHYESSALPWERAAFIRARAVAGDRALGLRFLDQIRPFVWRRSLDFGAIRAIRALSQRIRDHYAQGQTLGPGYDVKRGRGGIREIEFYAQIHQLIHGGREPALRAPATLDALAALAAGGRIEPSDAGALASAYRLLRTVEHRLQMIDDQQTHRLPRDAAALDAVARLEGLADGTALIARLTGPTASVGRLYDALDGGDAQPGLPYDADLIEVSLAHAGFTDPVSARARIEGWRGGGIRALRSSQARAALEEVLPRLVATLGGAPDPAHAINRFDDLVRALPSAINLFRLLEARPGLLTLLTDVLAYAPALAAEIGRRADLLDGLIDATSLTLPPDLPTLVAAFSAREQGDDYQALLDDVRRQVSERRFALGVQLIEAASDAIAVAQGLARVAEAAVETLASATIAAFELTHGRVAGGELIILALGRFGGGVLTHASDLDLVYLFTGDFAAESDGPRPLGATQYFNRLASRISAALSVPTAAGPLYEIDTRLRPSGTQGLLAVSLDSFARYQTESAWTWEHMALTRARPVFGSAAARVAVDAIVAATLARPRDPAVLAADVIRMRGEIARHKPAAGPFDVKLIDGGLVDAEFAVHLLQLGHHIGLTPRLRIAAGLLADAGLLSPGFGAAHELLTRLLVIMRLVSPASLEPAVASRAIVARACGLADWDALVDAYTAARALIGGEWRRIAGLSGDSMPEER